MKPLVAQDQVSLGWSRCLKIALSDIGYRMFRASITVSILALAVAFLVHVISYALLGRETRSVAYDELARERQLGQYLTRFATADTPSFIVRGLVEAKEPRLAEYQRFAGLDQAELDAARTTARSLTRVADALRDLPPQARAALVGDQSDEQLFEQLALPGALASFEKRVRALKVHLPVESDELRNLVVTRRAVLKGVLESIAQGHERATEEFKQAFANQPLEQPLSRRDASFVSSAQRVGFSFEEADFEPLARYAERTIARRAISERILSQEVRAAIARETRQPVAEVSLALLLDYVTNRERARWLSATLASGEGAVKLPADRISGLFEAERRERSLSDAVGEEVPDDAGLVFGIGQRDQLLIALSFLVCIVGVANAMLMSVTERFTEIATMKCLGAMDRFVMTMFVFEALIQGAVGGAAGALLGMLLALLRAVIEFGSLLGQAGGAAAELALGMAGALLMGMLLAALAAVGPAFVAARLAPMEAMRVD